MKIERYHINTQGNDDDAYSEAIKFACKLVENGMDADTIILLARTKRNIGWLERIFDTQTVKQLFNGMKFKNCDAKFLIQTAKTYTRYSANKDIVISMALGYDELMKIDDYNGIKAIVSIPWLKDDIERWIKTWKSKEIRTNEYSEIYELPEPIVQTAMKELTSVINTSTGITHPSDNNRAKTFVRALYKYSTIEGNKTMAYLIRELDWKSDDASDMKKLIDTLNNGKYFQGGDKTYLKNHIKRWNEK